MMSDKKIIIVFIFLISLVVVFNRIDTSNNEDVVVFVIDSKISDDVINDRPVIYDKEITHGSIVARLIKKEAVGVKEIPLEVGRGDGISEGLYFAALRKVIGFKVDNPGKRVIVNISLAFNQYQEIHHTLIKNLDELGVLVIAAAGNSSNDLPPYPAGFEESIAVASAGKSGKEEHSNFGDYIDIAAAGQLDTNFLIYYAGGIRYNHIKSKGTSLSAPRVTGLIARILLMNKEISPTEAYRYLLAHADPIDDQLYRKGLLGAGVINRWKVLRSIKPYYFILEPGFLLISLFLIFTIILFKREGVVSIFLMFLLIITVIPIMLAIEELVYYINKNGFLLYLVSFFSVLILYLIIRSIFKWRKRKRFKSLLQKQEFEMYYLLELIDKDPDYISLVREFFDNHGSYLKKMLKYDIIEQVHSNGLIDIDLYQELLQCFDYEKVKDNLSILLRENRVDIPLKLFILEIMEGLVRDGMFLGTEEETYLRGILYNRDEDMWLRYQALRTIFYNTEDVESIIPELHKLLHDEDELVRLEAAGLLEDFV